MEQTINLEVPVTYIEEDGQHIISTNEETKKFFDVGIVVQKDTKEEAIRTFWILLKYHIEWDEQRSRELDRWKPFQKGDWSHTGGTWFTIFGFHFYFRYGKGMKHGWYIPFTKLNIMITNYWRKKYVKR